MEESGSCVRNEVCRTDDEVREAIATQALDKLLAMTDQLRDMNSERTIQKMKAVLLIVIQNSFPELEILVQVIKDERKHQRKVRDFNFTKLRNSQLSDQLKQSKALNARLVNEITILKRKLGSEVSNVR